jgi:hypothetical protein
MDGLLSQLAGLLIWAFFVSLPPFGLLFTVLVALLLMRLAAFIAGRAPDDADEPTSPAARPAHEDEHTAPPTGARAE